MVDLEELLGAVDAAFARTGRDTAPWPDPHPDRSSVPDAAYSRVTRPAKWRILGARADAWVIALVESGLATVVRDADVTWRAEPRVVISRVDRVVPVATGALELVIGRIALADFADAGVVLGAGNPTECIIWFPDCGCDACDSGSQAELDHLDSHLRSIVTGSFRRLSDGARTITALDDDTWSASNFGGRVGDRVRRALADPKGWHELTGMSWLRVAPGACRRSSVSP